MAQPPQVWRDAGDGPRSMGTHGIMVAFLDHPIRSSQISVEEMADASWHVAWTYAEPRDAQRRDPAPRGLVRLVRLTRSACFLATRPGPNMASARPSGVPGKAL